MASLAALWLLPVLQAHSACPDADLAVSDTEVVDGVTGAMVLPAVRQPLRNARLDWVGAGATDLRVEVEPVDGPWRRVNEPRCVAACPSDGLGRLRACHDDMLVRDAAATLWTGDGRAPGLVFQGQVRAGSDPGAGHPAWTFSGELGRHSVPAAVPAPRTDWGDACHVPTLELQIRGALGGIVELVLRWDLRRVGPDCSGGGVYTVARYDFPGKVWCPNARWDAALGVAPPEAHLHLGQFEQPCFTAYSELGPLPAEVAQRAAGDWSGALDTSQGIISLSLKLWPGEERWLGHVSSPELGVTAMPLHAVVPSEEGLVLQARELGGSYSGVWTDGGLRGAWLQGPASLPLDLVVGADPLPPRVRPQDPTPPVPYTAELVEVSGPGLRGTLDLPPGIGPHPGILLISGPGPHDRDATQHGHRPFAVLADALARAGIAVLRYDDRGVGASSGDFASATTADHMSDAGRMLALLQAHQRVDATRTGLVGHSEGASIAARLATEEQAAFAVLLAPPTLPGMALVSAQSEALAAASLDAGIASLKRFGAGEQARARREQERVVLQAERQSHRNSQELRRHVRNTLGVHAPHGGHAEALTSPWFRSFAVLDPAPALRALGVPVLAMYGERDLQVVPSQHAPALREALALNGDATVLVLPGLNHLLQPASTGLPREYGAIETTIDPGVLEHVVEWVRAHAR